MLVLFDHSGAAGYVPPNPDGATVDHVAFGIRRADVDAGTERLAGLEYLIDHACHDRVEWRAPFVEDPGGNSVELVCFDSEGR